MTDASPGTLSAVLVKFGINIPDNIGSACDIVRIFSTPRSMKCKRRGKRGPPFGGDTSVFWDMAASEMNPGRPAERIAMAMVCSYHSAKSLGAELGKSERVVQQWTAKDDPRPVSDYHALARALDIDVPNWIETGYGQPPWWLDEFRKAMNRCASIAGEILAPNDKLSDEQVINAWATMVADGNREACSPWLIYLGVALPAIRKALSREVIVKFSLADVIRLDGALGASSSQDALDLRFKLTVQRTQGLTRLVEIMHLQPKQRRIRKREPN